jgi:hypothetical protein
VKVEEDTETDASSFNDGDKGGAAPGIGGGAAKMAKEDFTLMNRHGMTAM